MAFKLPKTVGGWVGLILKVGGATVIAYPAITAVKDQLASPEKIPNELLYNYTGWSMDSKSLDVNQTMQAAATVGGGVALIYLGKFLAKVIR